MLSIMCEFLPLFMVRWFARHGCERVMVNGILCYTARPDVLILDADSIRSAAKGDM